MSSFSHIVTHYYMTKELEGQIQSHSRAHRLTGRAHRERMDEIEDDLGRIALLARALADLCIRKGLLTKDELTAMASEVDLSDGTEDGKVTQNRPPLRHYRKKPGLPRIR